MIQFQENSLEDRQMEEHSAGKTGRLPATAGGLKS